MTDDDKNFADEFLAGMPDLISRLSQKELSEKEINELGRLIRID